MYTIIGLGEQGRAILRFLLNHTRKTDIVTIDRKERPQCPKGVSMARASCRWSHIRSSPFDTSKGGYEYVSRKGSDGKNVVISCLPPKENLAVASLCNSTNTHYIDLGGDIEVTRKIRRLSNVGRPDKSILVPDCGLAPGLVSTLAAHLQRTKEDLQKLDIFCGGIPQVPDLPIGYLRSFNVEKIVREYSGLVSSRKMGHEGYTVALSSRCNLFIEGVGVLEAARTPNSISLSSETLEVPYFNYRTLRYPGHFKWYDEIRNIVDDRDKAWFLKKLLKPVSSADKDLVVLHAVAKCHSEKKSIDHKKTFYWKYDEEHDISAMAQATGYTAAVVAMMIHEGEISEPGYLSMENIDFESLKIKIKKEKNQFMDKLW